MIVPAGMRADSHEFAMAPVALIVTQSLSIASDATWSPIVLDCAAASNGTVTRIAHATVPPAAGSRQVGVGHSTPPEKRH